MFDRSRFPRSLLSVQIVSTRQFFRHPTSRCPPRRLDVSGTAAAVRRAMLVAACVETLSTRNFLSRSPPQPDLATLVVRQVSQYKLSVQMRFVPSCHSRLPRAGGAISRLSVGRRRPRRCRRRWRLGDETIGLSQFFIIGSSAYIPQLALPWSAAGHLFDRLAVSCCKCYVAYS